MGSNEGEAEEVQDTEEEVAMWPQRQRLELCAHKLSNVDSHEVLLETAESEWADSSPGVVILGFWPPNCEEIDVCCFKLPGLWLFVPAATGKQCRRMEYNSIHHIVAELPWVSSR